MELQNIVGGGVVARDKKSIVFQSISMESNLGRRPSKDKNLRLYLTGGWQYFVAVLFGIQCTTSSSELIQNHPFPRLMLFNYTFSKQFGICLISFQRRANYDRVHTFSFTFHHFHGRLGLCIRWFTFCLLHNKSVVFRLRKREFIKTMHRG